jgi:predicted enzyme related to lactoylglutathione lyase
MRFFRPLPGRRIGQSNRAPATPRVVKPRFAEDVQVQGKLPVVAWAADPVLARSPILTCMPAPLIEFPADDPQRALRFWRGVLSAELAPRQAEAGAGWEANDDRFRLGVHERGPGPGDTASLPYFTVADLPATLERVRELGGSVIHPGERWAICRDSEGSPFALATGHPADIGIAERA